jgi:beta-galactosidase
VVSAKGAGLDDAASETFGFREFWIEGRKFLLNGTEIRLRPTLAADDLTQGGITETVAASTDDIMSAGFNFVECWPWNHNERGKAPFRELLAASPTKRSAHLGAHHLGQPFIMGPTYKFIWDEKQKAEWERQMVAEWRRYRNHPSVVLFTPSANFFGHTNDQDPRLIGRGGVCPEPRLETQRRRRARSRRPAQKIRPDPARLYTPGRGCRRRLRGQSLYGRAAAPGRGGVDERLGDERRLAVQAIPYIGIEFMTPFTATMHRGRNGYGPAIGSEPLMTEFAAAYLGTEAYRAETPEYRKRMRDS